MEESGWFYGTFVDPFLISMRKQVTKQIQEGEKVIDVACGTGAQVFHYAEKTARAVGVDLSESMISRAVKAKSKKGVDHVEFVVCDATNLSRFASNEFDAATMSLALHQFYPELYPKILAEMKRVAKRIILVDYAVPLPKNIAGYGSRFAESLTDKEHHQNFKRFCALGGLDIILPQNQLKIHKSIPFGKDAFQLAVCSPSV